MPAYEYRCKDCGQSDALKYNSRQDRTIVPGFKRFSTAFASVFAVFIFLVAG